MPMWKIAVIIIVITVIYAAAFKLIRNMYVANLPASEKISMALIGKKKQYPRYLIVLGAVLAILIVLSVISLIYLVIYGILLL